MQIDYLKDGCICEENKAEVDSTEMTEFINAFLSVESIYFSAIREISNRIEILIDELKTAKAHNPICNLVMRVKTPKSIAEKLIRKGCDLSIQAAKENINDIAGVRIICRYIDDIYTISQFLEKWNDIELLNISDYVQNPKPNGYRSLHLDVAVPVSLPNRIEKITVEIQIRTLAMDYWASLEHDLAYKLSDQKTDEMAHELKDCADVIAQTDSRMQKLKNIIYKG
jgi:putative GTP pyrophosphokinase